MDTPRTSNSFSSSTLVRYAVSLIVTALGLLVRSFLSPVLGTDAPLLVSILAVMFSAWYGGLGPGLIAIVVSAIVGKYFFIPPLLSLGFDRFSDVLRVVLFVAISLCATWLTESLRATAEARRRAERLSRGQTAALTHALDTLTGRPDLDAFLVQIMSTVAEQLGALRASLWFADPAGETLTRYQMGRNPLQTNILEGPNGADEETLLARELPLWQELVRTRRALVVDDVASDPRVANRESLLRQGVQTLLLVPLFLGGEAIGLLSILGTTARRYQPEEIALAHTFAQEATLALQLAENAAQGQQIAILEERNRLAREIHDTLAQGLTGIVIQLDTAEDMLAEDPDRARGHLERARSLARESLTEARRSVLALRPHALEGSTLADALTRHVAAMTTGTSIDASVKVHGTPHPLRPDMEAELLRIGLEAVTNVLKHAHARHILITLTFEAHHVRLSVRDDGTGADTTRLSSGQGFGLTSMCERAERLGGTFTLRSQPGNGTEVLVIVPARVWVADQVRSKGGAS